MCGLFGWKFGESVLNDKDIHHYTLAAYLAHMADRRGDESWGVAMGDDGRTILKDVGSIKRLKIRKILDKQVMGHTRRATSGAVTVSNAHPFHIGRIIGAHNGFVYEHEALNKEHKRDFQVDSQHIFAHINEGISLKDLSACGAVTYLNTDKPEEVFLGRGVTGDLAIYGIGTYQKPRGVVWASTDMWVKEALELAGCRDFFSYDIKYGHLYRLEGFRVMEAGDLPLAISNGPSRGIQSRCDGGSAYRGNYDMVDWQTRHSGSHTPSEEEAALDEYWAEFRARASGISSIESKDIEHLPNALKKNQEVGGVGQGQSEKAAEASAQCDGCRSWGPTIDDYEDNARGIVYWPQIDEALCFQCYSWWGTETGRGPNLAIPTLRLEMDERFLR